MQVPKFEGDVYGEDGQAAARKLHTQYKEVYGTCFIVLTASYLPQSSSRPACGTLPFSMPA